jgi:hypothetical protein
MNVDASIPSRLGTFLQVLFITLRNMALSSKVRDFLSKTIAWRQRLEGRWERPEVSKQICGISDSIRVAWERHTEDDLSDASGRSTRNASSGIQVKTV